MPYGVHYSENTKVEQFKLAIIDEYRNLEQPSIDCKREPPHAYKMSLRNTLNMFSD